MATFVYPAVLFDDKDTNSFSIAIYDLSLFTSGATVEDAHLRMKEMLTKYFEMATKYGLEYNQPTPYDKVIEDFPKQLVILVEANLADKKSKR